MTSIYGSGYVADMTDRLPLPRMTTLIERLRTFGNEGFPIAIEAADELEGCNLDLHTERAAVTSLRAEIACLRESASLRVQFHAAELADVAAELANAKVSGIHSCHDGCTRSGCVNGRLREQLSSREADIQEAFERGQLLEQARRSVPVDKSSDQWQRDYSLMERLEGEFERGWQAAMRWHLYLKREGST